MGLVNPILYNLDNFCEYMLAFKHTITFFMKRSLLLKNLLPWRVNAFLLE